MPVTIGDGVVVVPPPPPQPGTSIIAPSNADHAKALFGAPSGLSPAKAKNVASASDSRPLGVLIPGGTLIDPAVGAGWAAEWAVVEIVSVACVLPVPLTVTEAEGENAQLVPVGSPLVQDRFTAPLKPFVPDRLRLYVAGCPAVTVCELVLAPAAIWKSEAVPVSVIVWGMPETLSVKVNEPALTLVAVGAKTTFTAQFAFGCSVEQVFVWENPEGRVPTEIVVGAVPTLVTVTACAEL